MGARLSYRVFVGRSLGLEELALMDLKVGSGFEAIFSSNEYFRG